MHFHSLGFHDIREGVTLRRMALGCNLNLGSKILLSTNRIARFRNLGVSLVLDLSA